MVCITAFNLGLSDQTIFPHIVVLPRLCDQDAGSDKKLYTCTICRPPFLGWSMRGRLCRSSASTSPSPPLQPWTLCVVFRFSSLNAKLKALTEVILRKEKTPKTKQGSGGEMRRNRDTDSVVLLYLWETRGEQHTARGKQSKVNTRELNESQMSVCVCVGGGLWGMGLSWWVMGWVGSLGTLQHERP